MGAVEDGLGDAAGEEVEDECQPEGVVAEEGEEGEVDGEEHGHGAEHRHQ